MSKSKQNKSYSGRITNGGSQKVNALYPQPEVKGGKVKQGTDLRQKGRESGQN